MIARDEILTASVTHLMRHIGYRDDEWTGPVDHARCEAGGAQGYTEFGPIYAHEDSRGISYHAAHDEADGITSLLVEAWDEVIGPWLARHGSGIHVIRSESPND